MTREQPGPVLGVVVPMPRTGPHEVPAVHRHGWRITEIDFVERQVLSRLDCDCGATDYRAVQP